MAAFDYDADARDDAALTVDYFADSIVEQLLDDGTASDDLLNDYDNGDSYHHESHTDREYSLLDAAELLHQLRDHEETDDGLWEGLAPRDAISAQAAYTFGNAVMHYWQQLIEEINDAADAAELEIGEDAVDDDLEERRRQSFTQIVRAIVKDNRAKQN